MPCLWQAMDSIAALSWRKVSSAALPELVERAGRITGYSSHVAFYGHTTAETNPDLQALIASAESFDGPGILVPTRNSALFRGVSRTVCASFSR